MGIGRSGKQGRLDDAALVLGERLAAGTLYRLLADHGDVLFADDYFVDLFKATNRGRPTVPARVIATVMLLQSHEGLSDREAIDRLAFDLRWSAAAGLTVAPEGFHPTVLVGLRNRLRASARPRRLFEDVNVVARSAGLLRGRVRVLDSTPLLDAVATQDTVTQLRAAIRGLLRALDRERAGELAVRVRAALGRDDDYATVGKPACDWDDRAAREALVDALVLDALAALAVIDGAQLSVGGIEAAELLALVAGQDVEPDADGRFRIVRKVARDRVLSTVDTQARHGHKSRARTFDGYKTHLSLDPDSELIAEVVVTPANTPDRDAIDELLAGEVGKQSKDTADDTGQDAGADSTLTVMGDSAYADGPTLERLGAAGHTVMAKVPPARNATGGFAKDRFDVDLLAGTVTCPAGNTVAIVPVKASGGRAAFGKLCVRCPLQVQCTKARVGRVVMVHPQEQALQTARAAQQTPQWQAAYRAVRPGVERKISHFVRRPWGGRQARCRGQQRILTDVLTRGAALNLARLSLQGLRFAPPAGSSPDGQAQQGRRGSGGNPVIPPPRTAPPPVLGSRCQRGPTRRRRPR